MKPTKAIILVGGEGTRLAPFSTITNKSLFPINDKFVIDYPLNTLRQLGITDLMVILGGNNNSFAQIVSYIKDGQDFGFSSVQYCYQRKAAGISQAINLCKSFINEKEKFITILGDNVFSDPVNWNYENNTAKVALYQTPSLHRFGVASINNYEKIIKIEEKPKTINENYKNYAITGIYSLDYRFFDFFKRTVPSARGEFEITSILEQYLAIKELDYSMVTGIWSDAGTFESARYISNYLYEQPIEFVK